jgi:hypothetical protein
MVLDDVLEGVAACALLLALSRSLSRSHSFSLALSLSHSLSLILSLSLSFSFSLRATWMQDAGTISAACTFGFDPSGKAPKEPG